MRSFLLIITAYFIAVFSAAAVGFAPVRNFSRQTYNAGSQNWAVAQDRAGRVFFANREGLLKFDGTRWSLFFLPNFTTVRAVLADDDSGRVYVGGSGEFGFFHTNPSSLRMEYVSWADILPADERHFSEIWQIHRLRGNRLVFQGDYKLFITDGETISVVSADEKLTASYASGDELYAGSQSGNLYRLSGDHLHKMNIPQVLSRIVAILPCDNESMLIVTSADGTFIYRNGELSATDWNINSFLIENQAFCASYSDGMYAFGTVNRGAVTRDMKTGQSTYINRETGLQDNTVLGLGFDFSHNLWLCLDNGISYALVDAPVFNLLGEKSEAGAGYASMRFGDRLWLATNRGLFFATYPFEESRMPPKLSRVLGGQVWSIDSIGPDIFISADDGLYILNPKSGYAPVKAEGMNIGAWYAAPLKANPGKILVSSYDGFRLLSRRDGRWIVDWKIEGYDEAGGKFMEDEAGNIWIAHWLNGVYRLTPADDYSRVSQVKLFTEQDGLPSPRDNSLTTIGRKMRIATASGRFFVPGPDDSLSPDNELSAMIPLHDPVHFYELPSGMAFAFSPKIVWKMEKDEAGAWQIDSVSLRPISNSLIPGFEHIGFLDQDNMLISNQEGFFNVNLKEKHAEKWKNGVFVESLVAGDSVIFSGLPPGFSPDIELPYALNSLTFHFAAPEYRIDNAVLYSCMLEDYDSGWSSPSENSSKEYTQLSEGKYTLRIRAFNTVTGETAETSLSFTILPPWYRGPWAKIVYVIILLILIFLGYRLFVNLSRRNAAKVKRQKEAELDKLKNEAEKEAMQKDLEIESLKSSRLELDIKHKSSELSNTTMNVIRKNEILLDISSLLAKLYEKAQEEGSATPQLRKGVDKINTLIHDNISHDDDWKKFNQNFDIVYADFTKHLSELHPTLTVSEKRLCCYLKMGLSSKEIAPILNISPKSVEMNRYRLRRKMGLEREDNLVEYLQSI